MKKVFFLICAFLFVLTLTACGGGTDQPRSANDDPSQPSASQQAEPPSNSEQSAEQDTAPQENSAPQESEGPEESTVPDGSEAPQETSRILVAYFSATNNTEGVAQKLADGLGADLYEIVPEEPYTDEDLDYGNSQSRTSVEMDDPEARPAISGTVENMEQYDIVLIGYPIWWGEAPRIMSTFIESYDLSGKTLAAFCTSASSGFGNSDSALRSAASGSTWLDGHRFSAGASADDVMAWANGLGIN